MAVGCLGVSSAVLAANYNELINGDLSGDPSSPTPLAIDAGSNVIRGSVTDNPLDLDIVTLNVPAGLEITSIQFTNFDLISEPSDGGMLVALEPGSQITDLNSAAALRGFAIAGVAPGTRVGEELLDDLGGAPLDAGAWTLWVQNTGSVTDYEFTVTAAAVAPPPPTSSEPRTAAVPALDSLGLLALLLGVGLVAGRALRNGN
ncbi:MAG: hypothetical protein V2I57_07665 [Xanthomonadales bacterium]|nr:hypothetical protein [Xanthomonadales bacterium]